MAADKNVQKKSGQGAVMGKVMGYIRRYWFMVGLSLVLAAVTVVLTLYIPILTGDAVDLLLGEGNVSFEGVFSIMKQIVVVMLITAAAQWLMNTCNNHITYHVVKDIREDAFHRLEQLPLKYLDAHAYGEIVSRVVADVDTFADGLLMGFTQLLCSTQMCPLRWWWCALPLCPSWWPALSPPELTPCSSSSPRPGGSRLPWWRR